MKRLFGTDGIRGIAGEDLTEELAYSVGKVLTFILRQTQKQDIRILIGRDTRISGGMLEDSLIKGISEVGGEVVCLGVVPTPAVAYLTKKHSFDAGIMISASHNPYRYNGIKIFNSKGYKLDDDKEIEIEDWILNKSDVEIQNTKNDTYNVKKENNELLEEYIEFIESSCNERLEGIKVAIDCANGSSSKTAERILKGLGAQVHVIANTPDGENINENCGSTHMNNISNLVKNEKFDLGFAFDGDADRCLAVDKNGNIIDGDVILGICGLHMKENKTLKNNTLVATIMSNVGFVNTLKKQSINIETTNVGDKYVLEKMIEKGYNLGGEQSGHVIFSDYATTGDGVLTAVQILLVLKATNQSLDELASEIELLPQILVNAKVTNEQKSSYKEDPKIQQKIAAIIEMLSGNGRVLIRPSGTEPLVRVMLEGKNYEMLKKEAQELASMIEAI